MKFLYLKPLEYMIIVPQVTAEIHSTYTCVLVPIHVCIGVEHIYNTSTSHAFFSILLK